MKKYQIKYFRVVLIAGLIFSLQSCLKNNNFYTDFSKGKPALELPLAAKYVNKPFAVSFEAADTPTTYNVAVNVASVNIPTGTTTATLALDQAYLTQYNTTQTVPFELLPDSTYQIPSFDVTVPANQRVGLMPIKFLTDKIASGHKYCLPITIVNSSINISSWNHLMLNVGAKSPWDGKYSIHVEISGANSYAGTVFDDSGYPLSTVTANSVAATGDIGDWFGGYSQFTFNDDGSVSILAGGDVSDPNGYGAVVTESSYDESNRSFHVIFNFLGGKYIFEMTFTKQ